jgi:hypothetical protein
MILFIVIMFFNFFVFHNLLLSHWINHQNILYFDINIFLSKWKKKYQTNHKKILQSLIRKAILSHKHIPIYLFLNNIKIFCFCSNNFSYSFIPSFYHRHVQLYCSLYFQQWCKLIINQSCNQLKKYSWFYSRRFMNHEIATEIKENWRKVWTKITDNKRKDKMLMNFAFLSLNCFICKNIISNHQTFPFCKRLSCMII